MGGAARFLDLVQCGYYDESRIHRVVPGFMAQFGLCRDPAIYADWGNKPIQDDKVTQSNTRGMMSFAMRGPDTRTCQCFINFGDNSSLDSQGFSPFGKVVEGMDVVDEINNEYGEEPYRAPGIKEICNEALKSFDRLTTIERVEAQ